MSMIIKSNIIVLLLAATFIASESKATASREFLMSAGYGVLAGTMVGAASLAFSDRPGDNLNRVARGASFGLYAGILLGLYVVYGVPNAEEQAIRDQLGAAHITPTFGPTGRIDGAEIKVSLVEF